MPLRLDVIDVELQLNCLKAGLFRGSGVVNDETSLDVVKDCRWSVSVLGDKLVVAEHKTAVILSVAPESASVHAASPISAAGHHNNKTAHVKIVSQINIDEYESSLSPQVVGSSVEIGAVLCLPVQTHASTWWTCVVIATNTGIIHFFTDDGRHLAWQRMHTRAAVDITVSAFALAEPGAYTQRDSVILLIHFDDGVAVAVDGSHLLQCLDTYRRSKAKIFARALPSQHRPNSPARNAAATAAVSSGSGESEELFPLIQYTKLSVSPQAFSPAPSTSSTNEIQAVSQPCIRRRCSRLEQLQNASFLGGFDATVRTSLPSYYIYVSPSTFNLLSSHELLTFSFVADDHIHISITELASLAADKLKSSVKSTLKSASSTLFGLTSALRGRPQPDVNADDSQNVVKPEELLNTKRAKPQATKTVVQEPRFALDERTGSERQITRLACSPSGLLVACADNLARVMLIDVISGMCVHIFKGYRDAQIAWLLPDADDTVPPADIGTDAEKFPKQTRSNTKHDGDRHRAACLVIYEAKRGLIELWRCDHQPARRIFAQTVAKNARLLSSCSAMLAAPFWSASSSSAGSSAIGVLSPMPIHSHEHRHQQPHGKCFLLTTAPIINNASTVIMIPLRLHPYLLANEPENDKITPSEGFSIQQNAARDVALVQNFKTVLSDYSTAAQRGKREGSDADDQQIIDDLATNFDALQNDTYKMDCILHFMHATSSVSATTAIKILHRLLALVAESKRDQLSKITASSDDDIKRRFVQGHIWHVLETCIALAEFYRYAVAYAGDDESILPPADTGKSAKNLSRNDKAKMSLVDLLAITDDECMNLLEKCSDVIIQAQKRQQKVTLPAELEKLIALSWNEFATQAFDLKAFISKSSLSHLSELSVRNNAQNSQGLARILFSPLFINNAKTEYYSALATFIDSSSNFRLNYFDLLQNSIHFWCGKDSPLLTAAGTATTEDKILTACRFSRYLFTKCNEQEKMKISVFIEREVSGSSNLTACACLPLVLTFRGAVDARDFSLAVIDDTSSDVDSNAVPDLKGVKRKLLKGEDDNGATPEPPTAQSDTEEQKNIDELVNSLTLMCYRLDDLLAYEHLTSLTHDILTLPTTTATAEQQQIRLKKGVPKKMTISDVREKGGLTEYLAKWIVWIVMPSNILSTNDVHRALLAPSDADVDADDADVTEVTAVPPPRSNDTKFTVRFADDDNNSQRQQSSPATASIDSVQSPAVSFSPEVANALRTRLAHLHARLPLSLACEDVMANCTWEAARAWHEQPYNIVWLQMAVEFAERVRHNALVRHGLCSMIWHVVGVAQRLHALTLLCDRCNGRVPKERVVREASDVGFASQNDTIGFLHATMKLLQLSLQTTFLIDSNEKEQNSDLLLLALPEIESRWSTAMEQQSNEKSKRQQRNKRTTAALYDIAIEQKRMNIDLLQLHALQVEVLQAVFLLQLRTGSVKLLALFSAAQVEALNTKLDSDGAMLQVR